MDGWLKAAWPRPDDSADIWGPSHRLTGLCMPHLGHCFEWCKDRAHLCMTSSTNEVATMADAHAHWCTQSLAVNGCSGANDSLWDRVNGAGTLTSEHALQTLSCVGCRNLRSCRIGLKPATEADMCAQVHLPPGLSHSRQESRHKPSTHAPH